MKGLNQSSFGLLIAFFLPGLLGIFAVSFWSDTVAGWVRSVQQPGTNLDLLSTLLLMALALGLELTVVRWVVFEKLLCHKYYLPIEAFEMLDDQETLSGFRTAIEEHYRYHQFWGSTAIALPLGFAGWLCPFGKRA